MRAVFMASHQPSLYMARLPTASKYCCVWCSGAFSSVSESLNPNPCSGSWAMPSTVLGAGMPATSRIVGAMSITCVQCGRSAPVSVTRAGQWTTIGSRFPPRCEPTCLPHWNGVLPAHAQAAAKWGATISVPQASIPP